jgi:hemerythrin-like metal-binding protein
MEQRIWQLEWNETLSVGIPEIDREHQVFSELVNDLNRAISYREGIPEIRRRMQLILDDAVQHFSHEENLLRQWHYPGVDEHAQKHAQALHDLADVMARFDERSLEYEWIAGGLKVKETLVDHLLTEDMKYRDYFRSLRHRI